MKLPNLVKMPHRFSMYHTLDLTDHEMELQPADSTGAASSPIRRRSLSQKRFPWKRLPVESAAIGTTAAASAIRSAKVNHARGVRGSLKSPHGCAKARGAWSSNSRPVGLT
jgi:hypothetical protein